MEGAFFQEQHSNKTNNFLLVYVQLIITNDSTSYAENIAYTENITEIWKIPVAPAQMQDNAIELKKRHVFELGNIALSKIQNQNAVLRLQMVSNLNATLPVQFSYDANPIDTNTGVIYAAVVLLGLYIMIIWEVCFLSYFFHYYHNTLFVHTHTHTHTKIKYLYLYF